MGGCGSGRFYRWDKKTTVEECRVLDVSRLYREDLLGWDRRWSGSWIWSDAATGERTSSVGMEIDTTDEWHPWVRLFYRFTQSGQEVDYKIRLQTTRPHFGGYRWWLTCPLVVRGRPCLRRVRKLYIPPSGLYFGCRQCHDLTYKSCQESDGRVSVLKRALLTGRIDPHQALDDGEVDPVLLLKAWWKLLDL